jgi:hypothetical protein
MIPLLAVADPVPAAVAAVPARAFMGQPFTLTFSTAP